MTSLSGLPWTRYRLWMAFFCVSHGNCDFGSLKARVWLLDVSMIILRQDGRELKINFESQPLWTLPKSLENLKLKIECSHVKDGLTVLALEARAGPRGAWRDMKEFFTFWWKGYALS
jgi:hypothetical protein